MLTSIKNNKSIYIFILLAIAILLTNYSVMSFEAFGPVTNTLIMASLLDLTIVLPLFFYILVVRNRFSIITLLPVAIAGFWFAYFIVPHQDNFIFIYAKLGIFILEGIFIAVEFILAMLLLKKIPTLIKNYKIHKSIDFYFPSVLRNAFNNTFGKKKFTNILIFDLTIFYYGLFAWRKKWENQEHIQAFTFHKNSGYFGLFIMLVHAMLIEVIGVHFLIAHFWSPLAAWIFTIFDLYALFWIIADYQAIRLSPVVIHDGKLFAQVGVRRAIEVELTNIKSIHATVTDTKTRDKEENAFGITLPNFMEEDPQFEIELNEPTTAHLPYGKEKTITKLYITVDEKEKFYQLLQEAITKS